MSCSPRPRFSAFFCQSCSVLSSLFLGVSLWQLTHSLENPVVRASGVRSLRVYRLIKIVVVWWKRFWVRLNTQAVDLKARKTNTDSKSLKFTNTIGQSRPPTTPWQSMLQSQNRHSQQPSVCGRYASQNNMFARILTSCTGTLAIFTHLNRHSTSRLLS